MRCRLRAARSGCLRSLRRLDRQAQGTRTAGYAAQGTRRAEVLLDRRSDLRVVSVAENVKGSRNEQDPTYSEFRADRDRRAELLHSRRDTRRAEGRRDRADGQRARRALRERDHHAGPASVVSRLVRLLARREEAVRDDAAPLRRAGALAGSCGAGHARRRAASRPRHSARAARDPQGLSQGRGQLRRCSTKPITRRIRD